jgi:small GTP-binding protein
MPANLPPQYSKAEEEYRRATSPAARLEALREMFRLLPKHKGTEKLQADLKQKISRAKEELESHKGGAKKTGGAHRISRDGAGRVVLVGAPNSGKSAILNALTNAKAEVGPYPFTTRAPQPGVVTVGDVRYQLIDLPPITADVLEPAVTDLVRTADAALMVLDLADDDLLDATDAVLRRLAEVHVELVRSTPSDVEDEVVQHIKTFLVGNKTDVEGAQVRLDLVRDWFDDRFTVVPVSAERREGLESLAHLAYDLLGVMRVYTKAPGKPLDRSSPFTLPLGSTVGDLAREIHRDLEQSFKAARVWGTGVFDGQAVKRDHELHDADVVELHV